MNSIERTKEIAQQELAMQVMWAKLLTRSYIGRKHLSLPWGRDRSIPSLQFVRV
jgi:hypothetical protein